MAIAQTRVVLKRQEFAAARRLADSLQRAVAPGTPVRAANLAALAALTGRPIRAAALLRRSEPSFEDSTGVRVNVPGPVAEAALAYLAYAALGGPAESLAVTSRRVRRLTGEYVEPARRAAVELALFGESGVLAFPALSPTTRSALRGGHPLIPALESLRWGDIPSARKQLAELHSRRGQLLPGAVAADATFVEAWLMVQLGDSATASAFLDRTLGALPTQRTALLDETPQAAGLVRAMALRAELAAASGDSTSAGHWARAVATLWSNAEPALQPVVRRMHALGGNPEH
jgi:hypothetical protein